MLEHRDLYEAILARRSVRRYDEARPDELTLARVRDIVFTVQPLIPSNRYEVRLHQVTPGNDLVAALGAYGRFVNPPCYLLPYMLGERHVLADLGYRAEQIAVRLTMMGLGSCFIGCLGREKAVRANFRLAHDGRVGALLVFGRPSGGLAGRAANALVRIGAGATKKLPAVRIFFHDSFANPSAPPADLGPIIEAARHAPSAVDAQPWRFLWREGTLHLFVKRHNARYGGGASRQYNLYDGGVCMANVALALQALSREGRWSPYEGCEPDMPEHPAALRPLARLVLGDA
jgi:nitroreductase